MGGCSSCGCGGGGRGGERAGGAGASRGDARLASIFALAMVVVFAALLAFTAVQRGWIGPGEESQGVQITRATPAERPPAAMPSEQDYHRFGLREARPKPEGALRLATYNLLNLFDEIDDPAYSGREEDIDDAKPLSEREAVAKAIRAIDADVLAVQEIESKATLQWFVNEHLAGMGYDYIESIDVGDGRGIEQAVLSRYPIADAVVWPGEELGGIHPDQWGNGENWEAGKPIKFRRSPLRVTVSVGNAGFQPASEASSAAAGSADEYDLTLFIVHHKSGGPGGYWREKEAARIAEKVAQFTAAAPDANIAVLGDFNCQSGDAPLQTYLSAGFTSALEQAASSSGGLGSAEFITHESGRTIDHILVNPNLAHEVVDGSAFVYGTPARPAGSDWRTTPPPPGFASDHYPVVVDLIPTEKD